MNTTDKKIEEVLSKFGEPMAGNVWRVQGTPVIYHKALERIAAHAKIHFDTPTIVRAERDEAVVLVTGRMGDRAEWSIGEALIGVNYRVSGKQAAYVWAMAEKRAKDRVILKLIELHGLVYSEEEADEFKRSSPTSASSSTSPQDEEADLATSDGAIEDELKAKIRRAKTINSVTDLMLHEDTQRTLNDLPESVRNSVRDAAKARLVELGWPTTRAA
ncbi:MAG TPA: trna delta -isopentenylpyrophosphate transferase [Microvirga sp.]|jgi:hypothetical protein|nr:trna delta -isopentenylpyrophosphate transferase [Microvirga sp.]